MATRFIETEYDRRQLMRFIEQSKLPLTVTLTAGGKRSVRQNRLQRQWLKEIAEQLGDRSVEDVRAECKLTFGVPILRNENDDFRAAYDKHVKGLPYEQKIALMKEPFDFAVTRLMTTKQHTSYLDAMHRHYAAMGLALTDPGELLFQADAKAAA